MNLFANMLRKAETAVAVPVPNREDFNTHEDWVEADREYSVKIRQILDSFYDGFDLRQEGENGIID